ncbi:MAG: 50S ribosomal protein L11 methyltransferase, partial [Gammaproteobacteria bacterium]|nr:50S ribosomal protein L11 methyltransferase [Gammaproteobacteria bacterium]
LGASRAVGVDIDPQALTASRDNGMRNGCAARLEVCFPETLPTGAGAPRFDVVVANILSGPLIRLAATLGACTRTGARVALSGILEAQAAEVMAAFRPWVCLRVSAMQDGWVLLDGTTDEAQRQA